MRLQINSYLCGMEDSLKRIIEEFEKLKGQFVLGDGLGGNIVMRLIAIGADDEDYYYVLWDGRKTTWQTCVGWIVPLKNKIDDKYYNEFKRLAKINHSDSPECFMPRDEEAREGILKLNKEAKAEVEKCNDGDKYLTEICWDIN